VGDWDSSTRTATLTQDVFETIQIDDAGITLDGGGFTLSGNNAGIGIKMHVFKDNITIRNMKIENFGNGIDIYSCENIMIKESELSNNQYGINVYAGRNIVVTENMIVGNLYYGVYFYASDDNQIYNNNFVDNPNTQAYVRGDRNVFDLPLPIGGNYWSVWTGPDNDGDGFVDTPYTFSYGEDNSPWTAVDGWANQAPVADAGGPYIAGATGWSGAVLELDATGSIDPDGDTITFAWDLDLAFDSDYDGDPTNDIDDATSCPVLLFAVGQTDVSLVVTDQNGARSAPELTTVTVSILEIIIDIKPGSYPNSINLGSQGVIPVAFLTEGGFDAATIDPLTITLRGEDLSDGLVRLRGKKSTNPMAKMEDVDGDGDLDLLVHLETERLAAYELDAECALGALTYDGFVVEGSDSIRVVPE